MKMRFTNLEPRRHQTRARRRQRLTETCKAFATIVLFLCNNPFQNSFVGAQRHQRRQPERPHSSSSEGSNNSGWREWNYYQILGLLPTQTNGNLSSFGGGSSKNNNGLKSRRKRSAERSRIKGKDVKKAYRTQAQIWHPDKVAARKKKQHQGGNENSHTHKHEGDRSRRSTIDSATLTDNDYSNVSVEECTERFAKIAEAYEVLADEEKRYEYDVFLLDAEDQSEKERKKEEKRQQQERQQQQRSRYGGRGYGGTSTRGGFQKQQSYFESFKTDPMAVFEKFFFGGTASDDDYESNDDDLFNQFMGGSSTLNSFLNKQRRGDMREKPQHQYRNVRPDRTSETTHINFDSRYGQDVHKVMRREEFDEYHELYGYRVYYRLISQEFIEVNDDRVYSRYYTEFQPISEPYVMDEGYITTKNPPNGYDSGTGYNYGRGRNHPDGDPTNNKRPNHNDKTRTRHPLTNTSSRLEEDQYITPQTKVLLSNNEKYYAGLTPDCELVIVEELGAGEDNPVIWSTNTFVPPQYRDGEDVCFLALFGSQLAVMLGDDIENPRAILWNSPESPLMMPGRDGTEEEIAHYASLDDDGCLAVYRKRESSGDRENNSASDSEFVDDDEESLYNLKEWWRFLIHKISPSPLSSNNSSHSQPTTRAAAAWNSLRRSAVTFIRRTAKKRNFRSSIPNSESQKKKQPKDQCLYASGPVGCFTPGRYVILISKKIGRSIGNTAAKIDHAVDGFAEYLSEGSEFDVDLLDTLIRVSGRAGMAIGKSATRIAIQSVKDAKIVARILQHKIHMNYLRLATYIEENERMKLANLRVQAAFGNFVEFLSERGEEDEDVLNTFVRLTGQGVTRIAVTGVQEAKVVAKKMHKSIATRIVKIQSLIDTERFGFGIDRRYH